MNSGIPGLDEAVWQKRNAGLSKSMEEYCDEYRRGRCLECTGGMKEKRCCRKYPSGRTYCDSMIRSRTRKFRDTIMAEVTLLMRIRQGTTENNTRPRGRH